MGIRQLHRFPMLKTMLCFSLFLSFGSVFAVFYPYILEAVIALLTCILIVLSKNYVINGRLLKVVLISMVVIFISMIITGSSFNDYKIFFVRILLMMFVITALGNDYKEIAKYIVCSLWLIMFLALINFILTMLLPSMFYLVEHEDSYQVLTVGYLFNMLASHSLMGFEIIRNQAIFWEPGILQVVANMLIFYIIIEQNKPVSKAILPIFIVLTTASTTGFIILTFLLFIKFKNVFSLRGRGLLRTVAMIVLVSAFMPLLYTEVMYKFTGDAKSSSTLRIFDLYMGLSVALTHPIAGIGMNQEKMTAMTGSVMVEIDGEILQSERGNTNSIILMLVKLGFPITIIAFLGMYKQALFNHRFCFFMVLFLSLFSEPLYSSYIVLLFMMSSTKILVRDGMV